MTGLEKLAGLGKKAPFPSKLSPMLATLTDAAFDDPGWIYEIKWDGYRAVSFINNGQVELKSRNAISFNKKFYPVAEALGQWPVHAILDGEIVVIDATGKSDFQKLQAWQKTGEGDLFYYVFDLLWLEGRSLLDNTLLERKALLKQLIPPGSIIQYSDHIEDSGKAFFEAATSKKLEGIMAKKADSSYTPGIRSRQWLKIKTHMRQEVVIAGFTKARNSRSYFGALVLGIYEGKKLVYTGHTGSGFSEESLQAIHQKLKGLITKACPFETIPKTNMPCTWVKPVLVCEIEFTEWTQDNMMRHPIFMGLREDKKVKDVKKEKAITMPLKKKAAKAGKSATAKNSKATGITTTANRKKDLPTWLDADDKEVEKTVSKQSLVFTNLDKVYWPDEGITKRDLLNYYHQMAPFILPYMKDRPQSLNRHPNGIGGMSFYQKDTTGKIASWLETYNYTSESDGEKKKFLVCTDEASLLYMANLGCIEMNPWHSRVGTPDYPDWCVIDLDPDNNSFDQTIETAQMVKKVLDSIKVKACCKTSGSTGLHIYIPLGAKYSYDQSRLFAQLVVTLVHQELESFTSLERNPSKRKGKIYLDYLQNRSIQTIAAPYSLRPKPGATASAPLHWEEVKKGLKTSDFTIFNMFDRVKKEGDLFKPVLGRGIDLKKAIAAAQGL